MGDAAIDKHHGIGGDGGDGMLMDALATGENEQSIGVRVIDGCAKRLPVVDDADEL